VDNVRPCSVRCLTAGAALTRQHTGTATAPQRSA